MEERVVLMLGVSLLRDPRNLLKLLGLLLFLEVCSPK
jgi:hypothetical protein